LTGTGQCVCHGRVDSVLTFENVSVKKLEVIDLCEPSSHNFCEIPVKFDSYRSTRFLDQGLGQRTRPAADLQHDIIFLDVCTIHEQPHQIQIDQKMLAETLIWGDASRLK
ncbi:MAG: hypothetical protein U9Q07_07190, partial [Planctomycetota bacterium]|nr:hypothetical protein [Planctomycetota bacterium]